MSESHRDFRDNVYRVSQLDAERLDEELLTLFLSDAREVLRFLPPVTLQALLPELKLLLRLIFFLSTVAVHKPSPGNVFHNLRYASTALMPLSRVQRTGQLALTVVLPYLNARLRHHATSHHWARTRRRVWRLLNAADAAFRLASFVNLLIFFRSARHRSLADRVTASYLSHIHPGQVAPPAFEFLHSQLVWQGVAEGALLAAPLLAAPAAFARSRLGRRILGALGVHRTVPLLPEHGRGVQRCAECGASDVVMPHRVLPCRHLFCYVCVANALEKVPGLACRVCGAGVHGLERVNFG